MFYLTMFFLKMGKRQKNLGIPLCFCQKILFSFLFLIIFLSFFDFSKKSSIISHFSYKIGHKTFENFAKTQESFILAKSLPDSTILTSKLKQHAGFSFQIYVNFSLIDFRFDFNNLEKFSFKNVQFANFSTYSLKYIFPFVCTLIYLCSNIASSSPIFYYELLGNYPIWISTLKK